MVVVEISRLTGSSRIALDRDGETFLLMGNEAVARGAIEAGVGFVSTYPGTPVSEIGNIFHEIAHELLNKGIAVKEDDKIVINVASLGFNKVLGRGRVDLPLKIYTVAITENAKKKIEGAGGEVVLIKESSQ